MDLTLEQLINEVRNGLEKAAEDSECKDEKKEDSKDDKGEKKDLPPFMKKDDDKKDEKKDDEKSDDKEEKKDDEGQEKSASEAGAALAREIMEKVASLKIEDTQMNKQAQTAGQTLGKALLEKLTKQANAGDMTVVDGGPVAGAAPTKNQADAAAQVAEQSATIKPMPTGDGIANHATINELFDALVADAMSQGAASVDQVHDTGVAKEEGAVEDHAVPNQVKVASEQEQLEDEIEKAAAVSELVAQGVDFLDAVALVKQAAEEINFEMEKAAAMEALMAEGVNFDEAVELVKQASAGDMTVVDGGPVAGAAPTKNQADAAAQVSEQSATIKPMPLSDGLRNSGTINQIFDAIVADAKGQGAASVDQVHDTGVAKEEGAVEEHAVPNQVKVAAISRMVEQGVDFDQAISIVKEAEDKLKDPNHWRTAGRGFLHSAGQGLLGGVAGGGVGAVLGTAVGAMKGNAGMGAAVGGGVGSYLGAMAGGVRGLGHGAHRSIENQLKEQQEKKAGLADMAGKVGAKLKGMGSAIKAEGKAAVDAGKLVVSPQSNKWGNGSDSAIRKAALGNLAKNRVVQGGAATAVAGGAALAMRNREKKAAFDALVEAGVDFNEAAILVANKAAELYGE